MKTLKLLPLILFLFVSVISWAGQPAVFPNLSGETLHDKTVNLGKALKGKYSIIGIASSKKAENDLKTWMQPVYDQFINQNTFIPIDYNINIYFIPVFSGANKVAYNSVKTKTREQLDKELFPYVLFYKGSLDEYKSDLKIKDKNKPYFYVLNEKGEIVYVTSGAFTQKKLEEIEELVSN